jgi:hypothetical protein
MSANATGNMESSEETVDRIVLTLPAGPRLRGVATLVLGGIGSRFDLPYEKVDDLQLAVLSILAAGDLESVTIEVDIGPDTILVRVGPLAEEVVRDPGLERVLTRLVDAVEPAAAVPDDSAGGGNGAGTGSWIGLSLSRAGPRVAQTDEA